MSKTVSVALKAHMAQSVTTIATLWRIVRTDSVEFFFTNHDTDITYLGDVYLSKTGMMPSSISSGRGLAPANLEAQSFLTSDAIIEAELQAGLFDGATLDVLQVNYEDLTMGHLPLAEGWLLGNMTIDDRTFNFEVRSRVQQLQTQIVELYNKRCRAILFDARCKLDPDTSGTNWRQTGEVVSVVDRGSFQIPPLQNEHLFRYGKITWTDPNSSQQGFNAGLSMEIKDYVADSEANLVTLFQAMPYEIAEGDPFEILVGCDKLFSTCRDEFENWLNFRGEPYVPGEGTIPMRPGSGRHGWDRGR